jgi:hypothetical protein
MGGKRNVYRILVEKPEGKRSLDKPRHRWEDNIKMDLMEWKDWTGLIWLRIGTLAGQGNEPSGYIKVTEFFAYIRKGVVTCEEDDYW